MKTRRASRPLPPPPKRKIPPDPDEIEDKALSIPSVTAAAREEPGNAVASVDEALSIPSVTAAAREEPGNASVESTEEDEMMEKTSSRALTVSLLCSRFELKTSHNFMHSAASPYIVISGKAGVELCRTSKLHNTNQPEWSKVFVDVPDDTDVLAIKLFDHHNFHKDHLLGVGEVSIGSLLRDASVLLSIFPWPKTSSQPFCSLTVALEGDAPPGLRCSLPSFNLEPGVYSPYVPAGEADSSEDSELDAGVFTVVGVHVHIVQAEGFTHYSKAMLHCTPNPSCVVRFDNDVDDEGVASPVMEMTSVPVWNTEGELPVRDCPLVATVFDHRGGKRIAIATAEVSAAPYSSWRAFRNEASAISRWVELENEKGDMDCRLLLNITQVFDQPVSRHKTVFLGGGRALPPPPKRRPPPSPASPSPSPSPSPAASHTLSPPKPFGSRQRARSNSSPALAPRIHRVTLDVEDDPLKRSSSRYHFLKLLGRRTSAAQSPTSEEKLLDRWRKETSEACKRGKATKLEDMLMRDPRLVDMAGPNGWRPVHHAAYNGHHDVIGMLLKYGATLDVYTEDGEAPISMARRMGHVKCTKLLLGHTTLVALSDKNTRRRALPLPDVGTSEEEGNSPVAGLSVEEETAVTDLAVKSVLDVITDYDARLLWKHRMRYKDRPELLALVLSSVDWEQETTVEVVPRLLEAWKTLLPEHALDVLSRNFPSALVFRHARSALKHLSRDEVALFLPQLLQCAKKEPVEDIWSDESLSRFLVDCALEDTSLGHGMIWCIESETSGRVGVLSDPLPYICHTYMSSVDASIRSDILQQRSLVACLLKAQRAVTETRENQMRPDVLLQHLAKLSTFPACRLPCNPNVRVCGLKVDNCRVMSSNALPLWLVFKIAPDVNGGGENCEAVRAVDEVTVLFKQGDDLRQDALAMQILELMDTLWERGGISERVTTPYKTQCLGPMVGMIEVVLDCATQAKLHVKYGGVTGVFKKDPVENYLREHNTTDEAYEKAVERFSLSVGAYCVITYILGVGDRHNDNIMVRKDGSFFHIDFGLILGNWQRFMNLRRDRVPFILTQDFVHVIGGKDSVDFHHFSELTCRRFVEVRRHARHLIAMFRLMFQAGLPSLSADSDLAYLKGALALDSIPLEEDAQAAAHFEKLIEQSVANKAPTWNFLVHNVAAMGR